MEGSLGRRQGIVQDEPRVKETAPEVNIQKYSSEKKGKGKRKEG